MKMTTHLKLNLQDNVSVAQRPSSVESKNYFEAKFEFLI